MDRIMLILLLCSLDAGGLLIVVTAQPTVSAVILTPEADRKVGGQVDMVCTATNIQTSNIVVWRTENPEQALRWGTNTISTQSRFVFGTRTLSSSSTVQDFTIMNVQRSDTDEYVCSVYELLALGGSTIAVSSKVTLSVSYFPSSSFPMCSPAGPVTVDDGTNLYLTCSSEVGYPTVAIAVSQVPPQSNSYTWTPSTSGSNMIESSLSLTLNANVDNITFDCTITSFVRFPTMRSSCTIGPITVAITATTSGSVASTNMITSTASFTSVTTVPNNRAVGNSAVIVGAAVGGVAAVLLITILIVVCLRRGFLKCALFTKDSKLDAGQSDAEPATENPRQSYNEHAGLESIQTTHQTSRDGNTTATSPAPHHTVSPRHSESSSNIQSGPIYAQPNKAKSNVDTSPDATRHLSSTEQTYDNPVFDQDIVTSPTKDRSYAPDKPIAKIKPTATKPPRKPQPYQPKSDHKSKTPDKNLNHQENLMPLQSPTDTLHPDETLLLPSDPTYAEVSVPKRQPSSYDDQDGIVYADLDLQSDTSPDISKSLSADGQVVYATVTKK